MVKNPYRLTRKSKGKTYVVVPNQKNLFSEKKEMDNQGYDTKIFTANGKKVLYYKI